MAIKRLSNNVIERISKRFNDKLIEFDKLSLDELKILYNGSRMSQTDKRALVQVTEQKLFLLYEEENKKKQILENEKYNENLE